MRISDWSSDVCSSDLQGAIFLERHQDAAHLGLAASLDQPLLELRGLHVRGRIERGFKRAMFGNQLARGLGPDAPDARDIVRTVRSSERRVVKACVRPCRSRWSPDK